MFDMEMENGRRTCISSLCLIWREWRATTPVCAGFRKKTSTPKIFLIRSLFYDFRQALTGSNYELSNKKVTDLQFSSSGSQIFNYFRPFVNQSLTRNRSSDEV